LHAEQQSDELQAAICVEAKMALDPRDVNELQKALNDAAGKASALCARLDGAHLEGASLQNGKFGCVMSGRFACASLRGADLRFAKLQGSSLSRAQLDGTHFDQGHLQCADLEGAFLISAVFHGANDRAMFTVYHDSIVWGGTMTRITTSLAAIFLLSQVTLGHTQVDGNKPEPLDDSSSDHLVARDLTSLRLDCRKTGTAEKDKTKPWVHCKGEVATLLFRMLGSQSFGVEAIEVKKTNGVRYLERWSKQNLVVCWEHLEETNGDPIAIVFYECGVPS
jgi:preprotein translocase subunit SecG